MDITVNGALRSVPAPVTLAELAADLIGPVHSGIAIAVNGTVLPPDVWVAQPVIAGDRIDIITAMQGG